jgi:hypothetical protein
MFRTIVRDGAEFKNKLMGVMFVFILQKNKQPAGKTPEI